MMTGIRSWIGWDRAGLDRLAVLLPAFPHPGQAEGPVTLAANEIGLLAPVDLLPLVKAVRNDQAPPRPEGKAEGGLRRRLFRSGVRQAIPDGRVVGPGGDEAPTKVDKLPVLRLRQLPDNGHRLTRGDIEAGQQVRGFGQVKHLGHGFA
jgi:hypothetical protein